VWCRRGSVWRGRGIGRWRCEADRDYEGAVLKVYTEKKVDMYMKCAAKAGYEAHTTGHPLEKSILLTPNRFCPSAKPIRVST
jgi:hypothetical protein